MIHNFLFLTIEQHRVSWRTNADFTGADPYKGDGLAKATEVIARFMGYGVRSFEIRDDRK